MNPEVAVSDSFLGFTRIFPQLHLGVPDTNLKKCLGWHFELERHGSGLSESTEQIRLFVVGKAETSVAFIAPRAIRAIRLSNALQSYEKKMTFANFLYNWSDLPVFATSTLHLTEQRHLCRRSVVPFCRILAAVSSARCCFYDYTSAILNETNCMS